MPDLNAWDSFYVIVGSSAGALIGLQFVVMTLIAENPPLRAAEAGAAFATPTIVHFGAVLLLSALLRVPWTGAGGAAAVWALMGLAGTAYSFLVAWRMRRQTTYTPELEDWVFHAAMPAVSYGLLAVSAFAAPSRPSGALFGIGAAALLLLFTGIHNAWDSVAYLVFAREKIAAAAKGSEAAGTEGKAVESSRTPGAV